jgi:hypothetical protein
MVMALHKKWSLKQDAEKDFYHDRDEDRYFGRLFEVACAVNETIVRISDRTAAPFTTYNSLGRELDRVRQDSRQSGKRFRKRVLSPLAFGFEEFTPIGKKQREKIETGVKTFRAEDLTDAKILEVLRSTKDTR